MTSSSGDKRPVSSAVATNPHPHPLPNHDSFNDNPFSFFHISSSLSLYSMASLLLLLFPHTRSRCHYWAEFLLLLLLLLSAATATSSSSSATSGRRTYPRTKLDLEDIMPDDPDTYDKMVPPKVDDHPTVVYFHVTVMSIDSINENSMDQSMDFYTENTVNSYDLTNNEYSGTFATDIFFAQSWKDHRLQLPANMTAQYRLLDLDWLNHLWRPDSFFKNAKEVNFQTMTVPNHYVWLYKDHTILYMVKLTLTLTCAMNFVLYPHDTQECKLQMESLSHTTKDLVFAWQKELPLVVDDTIQLPQMMILKSITSDCTQVYSTGNFTCLEVIFQLKRRLGHYLFHTYIPTCLIVMMSWISFWIRPEIAPARVTLGVTSLLTLSTQNAKSQAALPPVTYMKAIDVFMASCTVFVFMVLMEYAVISVILGDDIGDTPKLKRPPAPPVSRAGSITLTLIRESARMLTGDIPKTWPTPITVPQVKRSRAVRVDKISRYLFPISFAVLNCLYWISFWKYL